MWGDARISRRIHAAPGSISTALAMIGTGAAVAWPEERWIGVIIMIAGGLVFLFGVRIDGPGRYMIEGNDG